MDNFLFKVYSEYSITSDQLNATEISSILHIDPDRLFEKGESYISKKSGSLITRPHTLWSIRSKESITFDVDIDAHLTYIYSILESQLDGLSDLKNKHSCERVLWIWIETDDAGAGIDITSQTFTALNSVVDRYHFTVLPNVLINPVS